MLGDGAPLSASPAAAKEKWQNENAVDKRADRAAWWAYCGRWDTSKRGWAGEGGVAGRDRRKSDGSSVAGSRPSREQRVVGQCLRQLKDRG